MHATTALAMIAEQAAQSHHAKISIKGYRGVTLVSNGGKLVEKPGIGLLRAEKVALCLEALGVRKDLLSAVGITESEKTDGVDDPWKRGVEIDY